MIEINQSIHLESLALGMALSLAKNPGYKIDLNIYSVENKRIQYTDYSYMTEFTDEPTPPNTQRTEF